MNISTKYIFILVCLFTFTNVKALKKKNAVLQKDGGKHMMVEGTERKGTSKVAKFAFLEAKSKFKLSSDNSLNRKKSGAKKKKGSLCCTAIKKVAKVVLKQGTKAVKCAVGKKLPFGMGKGLSAGNCKAGKGGKGGKSSPSPAPTKPGPEKPKGPSTSSASGQTPSTVFQLPPDSPCSLGGGKYSFLQTGSRSKDICCTAIKKVTQTLVKKATPILRCKVGKLLPLGLGKGMVENDCKGGKGSASGLRNPSSANNGPSSANNGPSSIGGGQSTFADSQLSQGLACGRGVGRGRSANIFSPDDFAGDWWDSQG